MTTTKFRAGDYRNRITAIEIERETDSSVWIGGRRSAKSTEYDNYFDTWDEAHKFLLDKAGALLDAARHRLQQAQAAHGNIKGMKQP